VGDGVRVVDLFLTAEFLRIQRLASRVRGGLFLRRPLCERSSFPMETLMTQRDLDCAVASATGEDRFEIRRREFSIVDPGARFDTEPDLRPHQILDWITALDPSDGASSNPHPHVQGISLCEGEGKPAIAAAIQHGRISEFFVLVRQILRTYNEQSAYRQLSDWHGVDCAACGDSVSTEDVYSCDTCRCNLCHDCEYSCNTCQSSMCCECRQICTGCDDYHCADCLTRCSDCGKSFCHDCHTDGRCTSCLEAEDEANEVVLTVATEPELRLGRCPRLNPEP